MPDWRHLSPPCGPETEQSARPVHRARWLCIVLDPHDTDTDRHYGWFDANMVAAEPGVLWFSKVESQTTWRLGHGAGVSYDRLFGDKFQAIRQVRGVDHPD
jgi:hypothetical protein